MKRFFYTIAFVSFFISTEVLVGGVTAHAATSITSWAELDAMRTGLSGSYILTTDLDSNSPGYSTYAGSSANSGMGWIPIGSSATPFTGTFDGDNYRIKDLYIAQGTTTDVGLFGRISGATIQDLQLTNGYVAGNSNVGGIVGYATSGYTLSGLYYQGQVLATTTSGGLLGFSNSSGTNYMRNSSSTVVITVTGTSNSNATIGGLIGTGNSLAVSNSYADSVIHANTNGRVGGFIGNSGSSASIASSSASTTIRTSGSNAGGFYGILQQGSVASTSYATGSLIASGGSNYGGFAGLIAQNPTLLNSYTSVAVTSSNTAGAFVGSFTSSSGIFRNLYARGSISANSNTGGFFGSYTPAGANTVTGLFWDTEATGKSAMTGSGDTSALTSANVDGRTTADMTTQSTFTNVSWDFSTIWSISSSFNGGYPFLVWAYSAPTVTTGAASDAGQTSVTLAGTISSIGTSQATSRGFNYGTTNSYGSTVSETGTYSTGSYTLSLTGLTCGTTYYYRAFATNSVGTATGSGSTFTTTDCPAEERTVSGGGGSAGAVRNNQALIASIEPAPRQSILDVLKGLGISDAVAASVVAALTTQEAPSAPVVVRDLSVGMNGDDVKALQTLLIAQGQTISAGATGFFGAQTKSALSKYQQVAGIAPTAGYFGPATRAQMKAAGLTGLWW